MRLPAALDSKFNDALHSQQSASGRPSEESKPPIVATPYVWRDPALIPPRAWLYGRHYIRKFITGTVAPGGLGKSSLVLTEALALATGRNLLGVAPISAVGVWYWNGEDPPEETERRIAGLCQRFRINPSEFEGRLFVDSGRNMPITIASMQGGRS